MRHRGSLALGRASARITRKAQGTGGVLNNAPVGDVGFGRAYQVEWKQVGHGMPVYKWQTADWVGMFPDILENYNKVL